MGVLLTVAEAAWSSVPPSGAAFSARSQMTSGSWRLSVWTARVRLEEVVMSGPNEPGAPEPGGQAATKEISGQRQTRRARLGRGVGAVMRHRATAIIGAALVGLLIGGGVVAAVDGPGHWCHGGGYRGHHGQLHQYGHGHNWFGDEER